MLIDEIRALSPAVLDTRNTSAIADALNATRPPRLAPTEVGKGAIIEAIGLDAANALLDVIDGSPDFRHAKQLVAQGWLRLDSSMTLSLLDGLVVTGTLSAENAAKLRALAEVPDLVSEIDVRAACWSDDGRWLP